MNKTPSYYRVCIATIEELMASIDVDRDEKNNDRVILLN